MMGWIAKLLGSRVSLKEAQPGLQPYPPEGYKNPFLEAQHGQSHGGGKRSVHGAGPLIKPTAQQEREAYGGHVGGCQVDGSHCVEGCEAPQMGRPA